MSSCLFLSLTRTTFPTFVLSCVAYRRKQIIGYSAAVLPLLLVPPLLLLPLLLIGDYGLLNLTAYKSTTVTPRPKMTMEHQ